MSTVFWSWQSDLDARITRDLIRDALAQAIDELHAELDERPELTSDTKGVPGSPDIVATIFEKIDGAAVFVGDVTPIAVATSGKALANPNVLIELGYANRAIGLKRIILVWNTAFEGAAPERLPFNIRGKRAPLSFHLSVGASKAELAAARDQLKRELIEALRASLAAARGNVPVPTIEWQSAAPATPAMWFDPAEPLRINEDGMPGAKSVSPGPYSYCRILPQSWDLPTDFGSGTHPPMFGDTMGYSWGTTRGGFLTYPGSVRVAEQSKMSNFTMQFRSTGELWGVESRVADLQRGLFFADYAIKTFNDFIEEGLAYLVAQGARGPFHVRLGITDLGALQWVTDTRWGGRPQALEPSADANFSLASASEEERLLALGTGWGEIAAAFGVAQPPREILVRQIKEF